MSDKCVKYYHHRALFVRILVTCFFWVTACRQTDRQTDRQTRSPAMVIIVPWSQPTLLISKFIKAHNVSKCRIWSARRGVPREMKMLAGSNELWRREEFSFGGDYSRGVRGTQVPHWSPAAKPRYGVWGRSWSSLQTLLAGFECWTFENLAQFT